MLRPYAVRPSALTPGIPNTYATAMTLDGFATGLLVKSHDGRPTKIEGNPEHPASLGAAGAYEQASILGLYDPARARSMRRRGGPATWDALVRAFGGLRADGGAGLRVVMPPTSSPVVADLLERLLDRHPATRITFHSPTRPPFALEGARRAFGRALQVHHDVEHAEVLLMLDADLL